MPARGRKPQLWVRVNSLASGELVDDLAAVLAGEARRARAAEGLLGGEVRGGRAYLRRSRREGLSRRRHAHHRHRHGDAARPAFTGRVLSDSGWDAPGGRLPGEWKTSPPPWAPLARRERRRVADAAFSSPARYASRRRGGRRAGHRRRARRLPRSRGPRARSGTARRDGFTGKLAIHPDQVPAINAAFSPRRPNRARAERIVAAFDGGTRRRGDEPRRQMIDRPAPACHGATRADLPHGADQ